MTLREPNKVFFPLAMGYAAVISLRNLLYDHGILPSYHSSLPVICVGNVTVGGSGKTPFVQFVAERLIQKGYSPTILSRGYGGSFAGPHIVTEQNTTDEVGDEAFAHFERLKGAVRVVVARKRAAGARLIEKEKLGNIIILDDGFQHRALSRDFDILLLDSTNRESVEKWRAGEVLPAGWLRESFHQASQRASCLVLVSKGKAMLPAPNTGTSKPTFSFQFLPRGIRDIAAGNLLPTEVLKGKNIIAATGIGEPDHFFRLLRQLGANLIVEKKFPDHHPFTQADLDQLAPTEARPLITTAKDAVKLRNFLKSPGKVYSLSLSGGFYNLPQEQEFYRLLQNAIEKKRSIGEVHEPT